MRLEREKTILVVIDIQTKLFAHMQEKEALAEAAVRAVRGCRALGVPILLTEQVPEALGPTIEEVRGEIEGKLPIVKRAFSCCGEGAFNKAIGDAGRRSVLLCGIESHVCVFQTARDLLEKEYEVHVLADAVSSRRASDRAIALRRFEQLGIGLATTEMVLFDLLGEAGTDEFRKVLKIVK
ncbi:MAG: hydrolase [Candidatus Eisenbacteria bacterium]